MAEMQQAPGPSRHRFQPAQKSCPPPNKSLQRTRRPSLRSGRSLRSLGSPLSSKPLARVVTTIVLSLFESRLCAGRPRWLRRKIWRRQSVAGMTTGDQAPCE